MRVLGRSSLFTGEDEEFAFKRAVSRLAEMQSARYTHTGDSQFALLFTLRNSVRSWLSVTPDAFNCSNTSERCDEGAWFESYLTDLHRRDCGDNVCRADEHFAEQHFACQR